MHGALPPSVVLGEHVLPLETGLWRLAAERGEAAEVARGREHQAQAPGGRADAGQDDAPGRRPIKW
jgi:hypothetical protein